MAKYSTEPRDKVVNNISNIRWKLSGLPSVLRKQVDKDLLAVQKKINTWYKENNTE